MGSGIFHYPTFVDGIVRVGTSGWNYPSGQGTWNGVFYPPARGRAKSFDELAYYAEHFDTVEVNSTFYGQPRVEVVREWARRTPPSFEFSVKLYQKFTHPRMFEDRLRRAIGEAAPIVGSDEPHDDMLAALASPNQADIDEFKRGLDPLVESGKLGALLAQFPPSLKYGERERDYLTDVLRSFGAYPLAVELRHSSWSDRFGETLDLLNAFEAAWVQIDEPKFRFSIRQSHLPNIRGFYYMRLHGRNAEKWWRHDRPEERYNYLYSEGELKEITATAGAARQIVKKLYVYTNNHFSAKSVANAAMIKHQLGEPVDGEYPPEFVERYPELTGVVRIEGRSDLRVPRPTPSRTSS
jgi:uncharacterized protein YecE (DUF72 family)